MFGASAAPGPQIRRARELAEALIAGSAGGRQVSVLPEAHEVAREVLGSDIEYRDGLLLLRPGGHRALPALPAGYGFKGGAARFCLDEVTGRPANGPRDIDVVRFGTGWTPTDTAVSRAVMPEDFERGWGVEVCSSPAHYWRSRDLSINEVLVMEGVLSVSLVGLLDRIGCVLRPCRYRGGSLHRHPSLAGGTAAKMLRLRAEGLAVGEEWVVGGIPEDQEVEVFHLALQLDKAFARSEQVARLFVEQCSRAGLLPREPALPGGDLFDECVREVVGSVYGGAEFFRNLPGVFRETGESFAK